MDSEVEKIAVRRQAIHEVENASIIAHQTHHHTRISLGERSEIEVFSSDVLAIDTVESEILMIVLGIEQYQLLVLVVLVFEQSSLLENASLA